MKNIKKVVTVMCIVAVIGGAYAVMRTPRTSTRRPEEVQKFEPTNKSQAKPEIKTTTEDTPKVEASQPQVESYNDSIAPTYENEGATTATTTTGSTNNKVVAEDNEAAIKAADEEIREAQDNGATVVESEETGVTAVSESQPAVEEKDSTQQRVDLDFSSAVDAVNEK